MAAGWACQAKALHPSGYCDWFMDEHVTSFWPMRFSPRTFARTIKKEMCFFVASATLVASKAGVPRGHHESL